MPSVLCRAGRRSPTQKKPLLACVSKERRKSTRARIRRSDGPGKHCLSRRLGQPSSKRCRITRWSLLPVKPGPGRQRSAQTLFSRPCCSSKDTGFRL
ncbi:unnamed protein product [Symbiodinium microadriaticum]|nr:unnamed protein product [Symbiodinium microadriaticum]